VFIQGILTPVPQELLHIDWIEIRVIRRPVVVVVVVVIMIRFLTVLIDMRQSRSASRGTTISASHKSCAFLCITLRRTKRLC
jgi:hypothetical protein